MPVQLYVPDGHLLEAIFSALDTAGYAPKKTERSYVVKVNTPELILKLARPVDIVRYVAAGNGVGGVTGEEVLENEILLHPEFEGHIKPIKRYPFRPTKLVAAVSDHVYPKVNDIGEFVNAAAFKQISCASEYEKIAERYMRELGLNAIVFKPAGKTEATLLQPNPVADIIIETVETGTTLEENDCKIIDMINSDVQSTFIVNNTLYDSETERIVNNFLTDIDEVLAAREMVLVKFNVADLRNVEPIRLHLAQMGYNTPTISDIGRGYSGVAIEVLVKNMAEVKEMMPFLRDNGAKKRITQTINTYGE